MTAKQPVGKKYVVKLSDDERERLNVLIQKGKAPARQLLSDRTSSTETKHQPRPGTNGDAVIFARLN